MFVRLFSVEKNDFVTCIGNLRGDARTHDAGAQHRDTIDAHEVDSRTVAIPWPPPMHCVASA